MGSIPGSVLPRGRDSVDRRRHLPPLLPHRLSRHRPGAECEYRHKVRGSDPGQNRVNFQQFMSSKASDKLCQCFGGCSWCHFITEVKPHWTRILLRWATSWKFLVLLTWADISKQLRCEWSVSNLSTPRVEVCHAGVISARGPPLGTTCTKELWKVLVVRSYFMHSFVVQLAAYYEGQFLPERQKLNLKLYPGESITHLSFITLRLMSLPAG